MDFKGQTNSPPLERNAFLRRRRKLLAALAASVAPLACAQAQQFSSVVAFGDSYADIGNAQKYLAAIPSYASTLALANQVYPTGRFSGGTNYVDTLTTIYGITQANYAIGGAQTGTGNEFAGLPGFTQEWKNFLSAGQTIAPNALVTLNIGGNDARDYYQAGGSLAGVTAAASNAATQAITGVNALVGAGAKTIVFTAGNVAGLPEAANYPATSVAVGSAYSQTYNSLMQQNLASVATSGVRVEYVNLALIEANIAANPAAYGFKYATACPLSCLGNAALQSQYLFYVDQLHLTSAGFAIMADYIANRLNAPESFAATANMGLGAAGGFVGAMFGRLDLFNGVSAPDAPHFLSYAETPSTKGPLANLPAVGPSPWTAFMQVDGAVSSLSNAGNSLGYRWDGVGGTLGVEYRLAPNVLVGLAYNFANPNLRLNQNGGTFNGEVNQLGLYGAYDQGALFLQGLLSYGSLTYANTRPGVISQITSSPSGTTFAAAFKSGYLFDVASSVRLGPIAGLTYVRAHIYGYTESGDPALTLNVNTQNAEVLLGNAGVQARGALEWDRMRIGGYVNVTAENYFNSANRVIQYDAVSAPLIVNNWTATSAPNHAFVRLAAGASAEVTSDLALTINLSQTIGQPGGETFTGSGGVKFAF